MSDMYAPHYDSPMILSLFWLADNKNSVIGWQGAQLRNVPTLAMAEAAPASVNTTAAVESTT